MESPIGPETDYYFLIPDPTTINPEIFEGFELFYKLFDPQKVDDELDANGDTSLSSSVSLVSLKNAGYARIASSAETASALPAYPLIPLSDADMQNEALRIKLEFSNLGDNQPNTVNRIPPPPISNFSRTLKNDTGARLLEGFLSGDFSVDDSDLPPDFNPDDYYDISIALYVLSYGNDYLNFSFNIHSTATYLGNSALVLP